MSPADNRLQRTVPGTAAAPERQASPGHPEKRRIFLDTEWTAPPWSDRSELMWIGLADEMRRSRCGISSEVEIDPSADDFVSGAFRLISPNEPRMSRRELAAAVVDFCGNVDEFRACIPTFERFAKGFRLGDEASEVFDLIRASRSPSAC